MADKTLRVNSERLQSRLTQLGKIGALKGGGVCRLALTEEDKMGRDLVVGWMKELGLDIKTDPIGNVVATLRGMKSSPCIMMGSHIDTVSTAGLFDGNLGVLAGLEVIETLIDADITPVYPISVAFFTNEEGSRFAPDMMGSGVFTGELALEKALNTVGIDGRSVGDELSVIGYRGQDPFPDISEEVAIYLELHVEQGPLLDEEGIEVGVVEGVQGISWQEIILTGTSNHAGTTPMNYRNDAGLVAAKISVFINSLTESMAEGQLATVGSMEISPNLVNVIPNKARLTVDLRNSDEQQLQTAEAALAAYIDEQAQAHGVGVQKKVLARFEPVHFHSELVDCIEEVAKCNGLSTNRMFSGAGHDAQMFAPHCPTAMVFVPSQGGISHNINEYTSPSQVEDGANVLLKAVAEFAFEKRELLYVQNT